MWSQFVQTSDELYNSRALRFREDNRDLWFDAMKLADGMDILEVGCGGGILCHRIKAFLPNAKVTGLDRDTGHIEYAMEKSAELDVDCDFVAGDALGMPFADNTFDACTSHTVIEHVETAGFLGEQYRVMKKGGVISVLSVRTGLNVNPENRKPVGEEESALLDKAWENEREFDRNNGIAAYEMKESDFPAALEKAGFKKVSVNFIALMSYAPDNDDISDGLALAQINANRNCTLESLGKALRRNPDCLTADEAERFKELTNRRYDDRIDKYLRGERLWDMATSNVMAVTGYKA